MRTKACRTSTLVTLAFLAGFTGCGNPASDVATARVEAPRQAKAPTPTPTPGPSAATTDTKFSPSAALPAGTEKIAISPEASRIGFVGSKVTGKHEGGFKGFQGSIAIVPGKNEVAGVNAQVDMMSLWSDNERLTGHLKSPDFFDVGTYPTSTFETTEIKAGSNDAKARDATHTVTGNLTLHGVSKSIQFPARLAVTPEATTIDSEFSLNRKDFGIVYPGMANDLIRDEVVIKLVVKAPRKA